MYYNLQAIILKRQIFREDDLLVTVYSLERGKLILQAKGAKKIKSKLAGHLEPVNLCRLEVVRGKQIDRVIGAQTINSFLKIKSDLLKLGYASYAVELIFELTKENHQDKAIFELLSKALNFLENEEQLDRLKVARIAFGFKLLFFLGFDPRAKNGSSFRHEISYIVDNNISLIASNKEILEKLAKVSNLLNMELEGQLEAQIQAKNFFKYV